MAPTPEQAARHARLNKTVRDFVFGKGFKLFPKEYY